MSARRAAVALLAAGASVLTPSGASAGLLDRCRAYAEVPYWEHNFGAYAEGSYVCDGPRATLGIEVCLEWLGTGGWQRAGCDSGSLSNVTEIWATAYGCEWGAYLIRSAVRGWSSAGESGTAFSAPVPFYCTPL